MTATTSMESALMAGILLSQVGYSGRNKFRREYPNSIVCDFNFGNPEWSSGYAAGLLGKTDADVMSFTQVSNEYSKGYTVGKQRKQQSDLATKQTGEALLLL